ncbi:MAG: hypothetical protein MUO50_02170, partial [Longimicrobiales bacterium]|nr:hypothetical protein [Longimicrobiales bacterium]
MRSFPSLTLMTVITWSVLLPLACSMPEPVEEGGEYSSTPLVAPPYEITEDAFVLEGDLGAFTATTRLEEVDDHLFEFRVRLEGSSAHEPPEFRVRWSL